MDSSPITQGAANSLAPKKESRTDMLERVVVVVAVERRALNVVAEGVKALADEPRVDAAKRSREWLWRGIMMIVIMMCCVLI